MDSLVAIVILLEYALLMTTSIPLFLVGRFNRFPNLGLLVWFGSFFSVVFAIGWSFLAAVWSIFETYMRLQANLDIWFVLIASIAPWALLAMAGILMALANQKLSPLYVLAKKANYLKLLAPREVMRYRKAKVFELEVPGYYAFTKDHSIYLTKLSFELPKLELEAVLRHEFGHIQLGHQNLKKISTLAVTLTPWFAVSRAFHKEIERLCELAADNYALRKVYSRDLYAARARFL